MALTYEQVIDVISKAPDRRKDFEVNNLLSWFRKKSQLFASLKTELLFDIIKNLQFVTKTTDELIIRQGDKGDCMYILLRGKVTIYIWYNKTDAPNDDQVDGVVVPVLSPGPPATLRQQLGTFVTSLGPGATFGEVALRQEDDCIRTASIIADETCDLIVVDRELYNRSVKYVLKKEFDDKLSFVLSHPVLRGWAPRYRKQLAMALEKHVYNYESNVTRQSDRVEAMYFVLSGEIKLTVDTDVLKTQYPKYYFNDESRSPWWKENVDTADVTDTSRDAKKSQALSARNQKKSKLNKLKSTVDVCLISSNEPIGDLEILMGLDTYCQTATATQRTDVLVLERKHYDRLMVKRNPNTVDMMRQSLELRLRLRMTRFAEANVILMMKLLQQTQMANEQRRVQQELQQARLAAKNQQTSAVLPSSSALTSSAVADQGQQEQQMSFSSQNGGGAGSNVTAKFIPTQGALINMYGPGTVFHWIRQHAGSRRSKYGKSALGLLGSPSSSSLSGQHQQQPTTARDKRDVYTNGNHGSSPSQQQSLPADLSEEKLALIESRIQQWMASGAALHTSQARTRVAPLRRLTVARDVF